MVISVYIPTCINNCKIWCFHGGDYDECRLCDVAPCRYCVNRRFGGKYRLHLQDRKIRERGTSVSSCSHLLTLVPRLRIFYPEDGGDTFFRNVGLHKIYTAPHPSRRHSLLIFVGRKLVHIKPEAIWKYKFYIIQRITCALVIFIR
jgi:hypothetical protein